MHGAGHKAGRRAGTENVIEIAGLGMACETAKRDLNANSERRGGPGIGCRRAFCDPSRRCASTGTRTANCRTR